MTVRTLHIRDATPPDREPIKRLHKRCFPDEMALHELILDNLLVHPHGINLVAEPSNNQPLIAYAGAIHGARPKARLLTIHVQPDHRRKGAASKLLDHLEERLIARKARALELEVHIQNQGAKRLYEERGFEVVRKDPSAYPRVDPSDGFVMQKPLGDEEDGVSTSP